MPHFQFELRHVFAWMALAAVACVIIPWLVAAPFKIAVYAAVVGLIGLAALLAVAGWRA